MPLTSLQKMAEKPLYYTIYQTTHVPSGRVYIGCHKTRNPADSYLGSGVHLKRAIKTYGRSEFVKDVLFSFDNEQDMLDKECELVTHEFCLREDTFNLCVGGVGCGFSVASQETRRGWAKRASDIAANKRRGTKDSLETKQKRSASLSRSRRGVSIAKRVAYIIDGVKYMGQEEALEAANVSLPTMLSRIKSDNWSWCYG